MNGNLQWHLHEVALHPLFQIELEFKMLIFVEEGKQENSEKNPRSSDENQQQTQFIWWVVVVVVVVVVSLIVNFILNF